MKSLFTMSMGCAKLFIFMSSWLGIQNECGRLLYMSGSLRLTDGCVCCRCLGNRLFETHPECKNVFFLFRDVEDLERLRSSRELRAHGLRSVTNSWYIHTTLNKKRTKSANERAAQYCLESKLGPEKGQWVQINSPACVTTMTSLFLCTKGLGWHLYIFSFVSKSHKSHTGVEVKILC